MKKLIISALALLAFASCEKENTSTTTTGGGGNGGGGTTPNTGIISWVNNSKNPYRIELNNSNQGTVNGNYYWDQTLTAASYNYKITQVSGYVFSPTVLSGSITVYKNDKLVVTFP